MTKREAKRIAYKRLAMILNTESQGPFVKPNGKEFSGKDQMVLSAVFLELRDSFLARSVPRSQRKLPVGATPGPEKKKKTPAKATPTPRTKRKKANERKDRQA